MKIYITGGTGFLGSNIIKVATERYNAEVFTTVHSWRTTGPTNFTYGAVDITDREQVLAGVRQSRPHVIIHSAILGFGHLVTAVVDTYPKPPPKFLSWTPA